MSKESLTAEEARSVWDYDPETGVLRWKKFNGRIAGSLRPDGYLFVGYKGNRYLAHRLIWLINTGRFPYKHIDHINGENGDNRIANLRDVTNLENNRNQVNRKPTSSGLVGVRWSGGSWIAECSNVYLGRYKNLLDAAAVRISRQNKLGYTNGHGNC